jgi:hypothetical protein
MPKFRSPTFRLAFFAAFAAVLGASCAARYDIALSADGSAGAVLQASVQPQTAALIASFSGGTGPILAAADLAKALKAAPGVRAGTVELANPDARSLRGSFGIASAEAFLRPAGDGAAAAAALVKLERRGDGGKISLRIDRGSAPALLAALSPTVADYLDALMAPAVTGEDLDVAGYLAAVKSVYGKAVADEIAAAKLILALQLPGPAVAVRGGVAKERTAEFAVPLADLLVLKTPLVLEAEWK